MMLVRGLNDTTHDLAIVRLEAVPSSLLHTSLKRVILLVRSRTKALPRIQFKTLPDSSVTRAISHSTYITPGLLLF